MCANRTAKTPVAVARTINSIHSVVWLFVYILNRPECIRIIINFWAICLWMWEKNKTTKFISKLRHSLSNSKDKRIFVCAILWLFSVSLFICYCCWWPKRWIVCLGHVDTVFFFISTKSINKLTKFERLLNSNNIGVCVWVGF